MPIRRCEAQARRGYGSGPDGAQDRFIALLPQAAQPSPRSRSDSEPGVCPDLSGTAWPYARWPECSPCPRAPRNARQIGRESTRPRCARLRRLCCAPLFSDPLLVRGSGRRTSIVPDGSPATAPISLSHRFAVVQAVRRRASPRGQVGPLDLWVVCEKASFLRLGGDSSGHAEDATGTRIRHRLVPPGLLESRARPRHVSCALQQCLLVSHIASWRTLLRRGVGRRL